MTTILSGVTGVFDGVFRDVWTGTLDMLRGVLALVGNLGQINPAPGAGNIGSGLWTMMLQLALLVAAGLFFAQLIMAVLSPRRNFLAAVTGPVQYGIATAVSVGIVVALLGAADGLTTTILQAGANVTDASAALNSMGMVDDPNGVKAVVLALLGIVAVVPLAIGYGIMLLFRSATILVLIATLPIVAAGLVNLATKHWFWRATRWLLALIFLQPTFALVFSLGSTTVASAGAGVRDAQGNLVPGGTGVVSLLLGLAILFVALFAPMGLFRLFAFVEPGTMPHQTMMSAFSSAVDGFKEAGSGIANADIGSVFSGATGGRFGSSGGDGSGGDGGDDKKQAAVVAATAAATGGASAAAGAGGAEAAGGSAATSTGGSSAGSSAGTSAGTMDGGGAAGGMPDVGGSSGGGSGGGEEDNGQATTAEPVAAPSGGASGRSGGGSAGGSSGSGGGSLASYWQGAGDMAGAAGSGGSGQVAAAGSAVGSIAGGAWGAAQGIAGYGPMPPAPHGGPAGRSNDPAATDYGGARPIGASARNPYRDPSYDLPPYAGFSGGGGDGGGGAGGGGGGGGGPSGPQDYRDYDDEPPDDPYDDEPRDGVVGVM